MLLIPFGAYMSWAMIYYLINFHICASTIKKKNYLNLIAHLSKGEGFKKFMSKRMCPGIVFIFMHFVFWAICHCWALLCFYFFGFHTFSIILWLMIAIWNSAGYYFHFFSRKYESSLKRLENVEQELQEEDQEKILKKGDDEDPIQEETVPAAAADLENTGPPQIE
jgi:hypothetical protein